ncbi:MAG TPA: serine/threonine-protein kinase, partial [Planctomycetia bacterium]|nr:serine/threonine-protein kinase [Planctomycetia bacterium]
MTRSDQDHAASSPDELAELIREAVASDPGLFLGSAPASELPGKSFGRFTGLAIVGEGGFGTVHRAFDPKHGRLVALKIPYRRNAVEPEMLRRFQTEAEAVAKIDHPGIAPLFETGEAEGLPYLASAYCEGRNLWDLTRERVVRGQPLAPAEAARIALAISRALGAAHDQGVVHRDVKPSNVILQPASESADATVGGESFRVRVIDFGLAKLLQGAETHTRTDHQLGTPPYMAPEQFSRRFGPISECTDVYGLGATLFALLAGRPPFAAEEAAELYARILAEEPDSLRNLRPDVPKGLEVICRRCLEKEPVDRYASMRDVAEDLERFLAGKPVEGGRTWLRKAIRRASRRSSIATVAGIALAVAAPLVWAGVDLWVTGDPLFSLHATSDLADELNRNRGLSSVPGSFVSFLTDTARAPVAAAGVIGAILL